ncbi:MAG: LLM class flavin-dependent oxidoreductase [Candidatus Tectomicrobia bacterium]|nr:LLM class flavin-dependent oxidoreductase [Candidatus Tectomicrobia bacterium]
MIFGIRLPPCDTPQRVAESARLAEEKGFDFVWTMDSQLLAWRLLDPFVCLSACVPSTRRVRLGVAVSNPFTRHPAATACAMLSLDQLSGGRAILGMGTGGSALRTIGSPLARMEGTNRERRKALRETVEFLKALFSGEAASFQGVPMKAEVARRKIPIYVSASGPKTLELAGELADGVIIQTGVDRRCVEFALEHIEKGVRKAGRSLGDLDLVASTFCSLADDRGLAVARGKPLAAWFYAAAPGIVELVGLKVSQRHPAVKVFPDLYHPLDVEEAMKAASFIPDEAVERLCLVGRPEEALGRVRELESLGITQVFLRNYSTYTLPDDLIREFGAHVIEPMRKAAARPG